MESQLNNENPTPPAVNSDFAEIVKESKENIQAAEMVPPKGKAGRKKLPRDENGKIIRDPSAPSRVKASGGASGPSVATQGTPSPSSPPPDISKHLIAPLIGLSKIPAMRYRTPELALTGDEAALCAHSLQECLNAFVPDVGQMSPKTAAVIGVFLTFGSIGFSKYQIYLERRPKPTEDAPLPEKANPTGKVFPTVDAVEAFRKQ